MPDTYKIIRIFYPSRDEQTRVIKKGLTLEEAQLHCRNPKTRVEGIYFDGYEEE